MIITFLFLLHDVLYFLGGFLSPFETCSSLSLCYCYQACFLPEILHTKKQEKNNQSPHLVWLLIVVGTHFVKVHTFMGIAENAEVIQHA